MDKGKGKYEKTLLFIALIVLITSVFSGCDLIVDFLYGGNDGVSDGTFNYKLNEQKNGLIVTYVGDGSDTELVIPRRFMGLPVTEIGWIAFFECSNLTSITIPDSVTSIGDYAFSGCYRLVEVINHSSLNIIAGASNYGEVALYAKEVHSGESKIANYNDYLFYTYDGINYLFDYIGDDTELTFPENYNGENYVINSYAFYGHNSLVSITIPDSVTSIGDDAFFGCSTLSDIYYTGSEGQWAKINIGENEVPEYSTIHYNYVP